MADPSDVARRVFPLSPTNTIAIQLVDPPKEDTGVDEFTQCFDALKLRLQDWIERHIQAHVSGEGVRRLTLSIIYILRLCTSWIQAHFLEKVSDSSIDLSRPKGSDGRASANIFTRTS